MFYYSNEIVFRGHPDKVADQISDALLDEYLAQDKYSRCGIETVGGKGKIFITGEVTSNANVDVENVVKSVLMDVGYSTNYEVINNLGIQSADIALGVDRAGAGDQGLMYGYACNNTKEMLPIAQVILQKLSRAYDELRKYDKRFLPDGKAQITGEYIKESNVLTIRKIKDFTISYQNTEEYRKKTDEIIKNLAINICNEYNLSIDNFYINPTGRFFVGGFDGDSGLTGRKLLIDNYHSFCKVGGGAFSGKDPTKVDRSGAYKARQLAIEIINSEKYIDWCDVQISYAIGIEKPLAIYAWTNAGMINCEKYYDDCTPNNIIRDLQLRDIKYYPTAQFGHFGNKDFIWENNFFQKTIDK